MAERPIALPPETGGEANASNSTDTSNSRPPHRLPKLPGAMVLTQINPDMAGYETHTFYCLRCDYTETKVFKIS